VGYLALERLDPTAYISIYYLHVPLVAIAAPLLGLEHPSRRALAAAGVSFGGVVLAAGGAGHAAGVFGDGIGLCYALGAVAGTFFMALAFHRAGSQMDATHLNAQFMTVGGVLLFALLAARGDWGGIDSPTIVAGAAIALIAWLPGRLFWSLAVREVGARKAGILGALQPGLVAIFSALLLHDSIGVERWIGIALLTAGVALLFLTRKRVLPTVNASDV
jgi:drug/metabolite transporter (DMT)-like permease